MRKAIGNPEFLLKILLLDRSSERCFSKPCIQVMQRCAFCENQLTTAIDYSLESNIGQNHQPFVDPKTRSSPNKYPKEITIFLFDNLAMENLLAALQNPELVQGNMYCIDVYIQHICA